MFSPKTQAHLIFIVFEFCANTSFHFTENCIKHREKRDLHENRFSVKGGKKSYKVVTAIILYLVQLQKPNLHNVTR